MSRCCSSRDELAVTLNDARAALEQYAEGEVGNQPLERCAALLHTARGVLQITETWGASLLAEEMEQTCRPSDEDAGGTCRLTTASRRCRGPPSSCLPTWSAFATAGRDVPLVLLPLLNDLRAARGRPLLSESTLLLLNIAPGAVGGARGRAPRMPAPARPAAGKRSAALAKMLRPRFQLALLGWIRGEGGSRLPGAPAGRGEPARGRLAAARWCTSCGG